MNRMGKRIAVRVFRAQFSSYLAVLCLGVAVWCFPGTCSADDLFVGNFFGPGHENILQYSGTTGAFIGQFGPAISFPLGGGFGPDGNFYATNSDTDTVLKLNGITGAVINATFSTSIENAAGLIFGPTGNLFVVGSSSPGELHVINGTTGAVITSIDAGGILNDPEGITLGPDGNLYVAGGGGNNVLKFNGTTGAFLGTFVASGSGGLLSARGVAFGPDGNLYVTSFSTNQVLRYNGTTGAFMGVFASATGGCGALSLPRDLTFSPNGNLFVGSFGSGDIFEYNGSTGSCITDFVPSGTGGLGGPTFLVFGEGGTTAVPEPPPIALVAGALAGLAALRRKLFVAN